LTVHDAEHPTIRPVRHTDRPLWSVMIPTYQCAGYLSETLTGVLEQAAPPAEMQIEVVDDASDDDPARVVESLGEGRVAFYRQPRNVGIARNLTTCIERSRGHLVHILHGDDALLPGFYEAYRRFFDEHHEAQMVFSRAISIDERGERQGPVGGDFGRTGLLDDALPSFLADNPVVASSAVVRRAAYESVGGFSNALSHTADWEMWMRVAALGGVGYLRDEHVLYRVHAASDSNRSVLEARNIDEYVRAVDRGIRLLPAERRATLRRRARHRYAGVAEYYRRELHARGEHRAALRHALRAVRLRPFGRSSVRFVSSAVRAALRPR
jgi:GT2 family glycosyltransferase